MTNNGWKTACLFSLSALMLTNAGHYYTRQVERSERSTKNGQDVAQDCPNKSASITHPSEAPEIHYLPGAFDDTERVPLAASERCINGERFKRITNGWASASPKRCD